MSITFNTQCNKNEVDMVSLKSFIVVNGLMLLPALVAGSPIVPHYLQGKLFSRSNISASTVEAELGSQLSLGSLVFGPDSPQFANATERWNTLFRPNVQLVVEPAAESDIAKIVSPYIQSPWESTQRPTD